MFVSILYNAMHHENIRKGLYLEVDEKWVALTGLLSISSRAHSSPFSQAFVPIGVRLVLIGFTI